jgi:hypothetical protein
MSVTEHPEGECVTCGKQLEHKVHPKCVCLEVLCADCLEEQA